MQKARPTHAQQPSAGAQSSTADAPRAWLCAALLMLLVLVAYAPMFRAGYIWDDNDYVTENQNLRSVGGLGRIWFVPRSLPQYYPLVHTTFWIEYQLWELAPLGYHLTNVLLHAANALLVWRLLLRLQVPGAWLAAALFAVHPVMVESVAWVTERKNLLSLLCALLSLHAYLRFSPLEDEANRAARTPRGRWPWYALALVFFAGALLSKTVVATLPAVILVLLWWKRGRVTVRDVLPLLPFFVLGMSLGLYTAWLERHHVGAVGDEWSLTPLERLLLSGRVFWFYAAKLAWPYPLAFFYPRFTIDAQAAWQFLFPAAAVALVVALWFARARLGRGPLAAVLIFAGVLFPALGFFDVYPFRYSFVADHFQYHASIALFGLAAAAVEISLKNAPPFVRQIKIAFAAGCILLLALLTFRQALVYHDVEILYRDTIDKNPGGWLAYMNLGTHLDERGEYDEAIALERTALELNPGEPVVHSNLEAMLLKVGQLRGYQPGQLEEIIAELNRALELGRTRPGLSLIEPAIHNNLGSALLDLGRRDGFRPGQFDEAVRHFEHALELSPAYVGAHNNLASALILAGQTPAAIHHLERSLEIDPENPDTLAALGIALAAAGRAGEARGYFERALQVRPESAAAHYGLAIVLLNEQQPDQAFAELERALKSDPQLPEAHYALAGIWAARGDLQKAADEYAVAVRLRPNYDRAWNNLGVMMMQLGHTAEAIEHFERALRVNPDYPDAKANLERAKEVKQQDPADVRPAEVPNP
ncbi:MAG: tetratricopeptide repeat protein [Singulisphaera sp.]